MPTPLPRSLRLGLIGDNIAASQAPRLHRLAGAQHGIKVHYGRLVPADMGMDFDQIFAGLAAQGYDGVNITYPYKERAAAKVAIADALVQAIAAVNTVVFTPSGPQGHNTDYSGFVAAYRAVMADQPPGLTCLIGAGGVGKAVGFGLLALGARHIRLVDRDLPKADALAQSLRLAEPSLKVETGQDAQVAALDASGLINCTPLGMVGYGGTPLPATALQGADWAFDAVYTPVETPFLKDARAAGLRVLSGYELFIGQGVDAWGLFSGLPLDGARLRRDLADGTDVT